LAALAADAGLTPARFLVYRPWEERHPLRKLYSPLKRLLFPDEFSTGGWLAMAAEKKNARRFSPAYAPADRRVGKRV
jgi:hypothetical protein